MTVLKTIYIYYLFYQKLSSSAAVSVILLYFSTVLYTIAELKTRKACRLCLAGCRKIVKSIASRRMPLLNCLHEVRPMKSLLHFLSYNSSQYILRVTTFISVTFSYHIWIIIYLCILMITEINVVT